MIAAIRGRGWIDPLDQDQTEDDLGTFHTARNCHRIRFGARLRHTARPPSAARCEDCAYDGPGSHVVAVESTAEEYRVALTGEVDLSAMTELVQAAAGYVQSDVRDLQLDLDGLEVMDAVTLGWLTTLATVVRARQGRLVVHEASPAAWRTFELTGIHLLLTDDGEDSGISAVG